MKSKKNLNKKSSEKINRPLNSRKPVPLVSIGKPLDLKKDDDTIYTSGQAKGFDRTPKEEESLEEDLFQGLSHFHAPKEKDYDNNFDEEEQRLERVEKNISSETFEEGLDFSQSLDDEELEEHTKGDRQAS